jgi:hypothetical protein
MPVRDLSDVRILKNPTENEVAKCIGMLDAEGQIPASTTVAIVGRGT